MLLAPCGILLGTLLRPSSVRLDRFNRQHYSCLLFAFYAHFGHPNCQQFIANLCNMYSATCRLCGEWPWVTTEWKNWCNGFWALLHFYSGVWPSAAGRPVDFRELLDHSPLTGLKSICFTWHSGLSRPPNHSRPLSTQQTSCTIHVKQC